MFRRPYRPSGSVARVPTAQPCTRDTPKCNFVAEGADRPDCCTEHLIEIAVFIDRLLTRYGVLHWLDWGSLLGAVRDQALIPWDSDVDFSALCSDWDELPDLRAEIEAAGFHLARQSRKRLRVAYSEVNQLGVDVYRFERRDGTLVYPSRDAEERGGRLDAFPESFVEEMETVYLYSHPFPAPSPVGQFLVDYRYGPTFMIPSRPIKDLPYPEIAADDVSPAVEQLLYQLTESQRRLQAAKARLRPTRSKFRARYGDPGLPAVPLQRFVDRVLQPIPIAQRTAVVHELGLTIGALDQATAEIVNPGLALWLRRIARTNANLATGLRRSTRTHAQALRRAARRLARVVGPNLRNPEGAGRTIGRSSATAQQLGSVRPEESEPRDRAGTAGRG